MVSVVFFCFFIVLFIPFISVSFFFPFSVSFPFFSSSPSFFLSLLIYLISFFSIFIIIIIIKGNVFKVFGNVFFVCLMNLTKMIQCNTNENFDAFCSSTSTK